MSDRALELRLAVQAEARTWVTPRTKFHHQACLKVIGVDCLQLVKGVGEGCDNAGKGLGVAVMDRVRDEQLAPFRDYYGRRPNPEKMREFLALFLVEIEPHEATIGDIAWTHWGNDFPIHMAIQTERSGIPYFVDAIWQHGTAEQRMTKAFTDRVTAWWRYPYIAIAEAE